MTSPTDTGAKAKRLLEMVRKATEASLSPMPLHQIADILKRYAECAARDAPDICAAHLAAQERVKKLESVTINMVAAFDRAIERGMKFPSSVAMAAADLRRAKENSMSETPVLKPCPFCGEKPNVVERAGSALDDGEGERERSDEA